MHLKQVSNNKFHKKERLCGQSAIDALFACSGRGKGGSSAISYPWRAVWLRRNKGENKSTRILVSVPKKRLRKAVERVLMRRRCREAYRLQRSLFDAEQSCLDLAFIYVANKPTDYHSSAAAVAKILTRINESLNVAEKTAE